MLKELSSALLCGLAVARQQPEPVLLFNTQN
jgi:hypothetical protein